MVSVDTKRHTDNYFPVDYNIGRGRNHLDFDCSSSAAEKEDENDRSDRDCGVAIFSSYWKSDAETSGGKNAPVLAKSGYSVTDCESDRFFISFRTRNVFVCGSNGYMDVETPVGSAGACRRRRYGVDQTVFLCTLPDRYTGRFADWYSSWCVSLLCDKERISALGKEEIRKK